MSESQERPESQEQPVVSQIIAKVHSRCDLACAHCYVYDSASGDTSWMEQPKRMSEDTVVNIARSLNQHLLNVEPEKRPPEIAFTFHGGEPSLWGKGRFAHAATTLRSVVTNSVVMQLKIQTDGLHLQEYVEEFAEHNIAVGVSLNGDREANDRHRRYSDGRSSYDAVVRGIQILTEDARYRHLFRGILAVADVRNDPIRTYESLLAHNPPAIDFLLPHGTHDAPPERLAEYAKWLNTIFDRWYPERHRVRIRMFDNMIRLLTGGPSTVESLGGEDDRNLVVIETNGEYQAVDNLKTAPGEVARTGLNVNHGDSFDEALAFMKQKAKDIGLTVLSDQCLRCTALLQCGGGLASHRYSSGSTNTRSGFANPSIYCNVIVRQFAHVAGVITEDTYVRQALKSQRGL